MNYNIAELAERIRGLREDLEYTPEYVAEKLNISIDEYNEIEKGKDISITLINSIADCFGIDFVTLLTGDTPKLKNYSVVRNGKGLPVNRRSGFDYQDMAYLFNGKNILPVMVTAPENDDTQPIALSSHDGHEFDLILEGTLKITVDGHIEILQKGDAIYYNSAKPHGMVALHGECKFLAVLCKGDK
ncbi:MAG: XRE family transcriptional regulator [Oscillospiraceae bacterium]|jgi:transcriptional regulator with XRE-family HTH domain|nr:XRE family transcriptional regulator [Oscillospiraceae bacterium]